MTEAQKLIRDYIAKGGKITKVPSQNFRQYPGKGEEVIEQLDPQGETPIID